MKMLITNYTKITNKHNKEFVFVNGMALNQAVYGNITRLAKKSHYYQRYYRGFDKSRAKIKRVEAIRLKDRTGHLIAITWEMKSSFFLEAMSAFMNANEMFWTGDELYNIKRAEPAETDLIIQIESYIKKYYGYNSMKELLQSDKLELLKK